MSNTPPDPERLDLSEDPTALPRRDFLKLAGVGAGALLTSGCASAGAFAAAAPVRGIERGRAKDGGVGHVVVIGAGAWGGWTAYHLRQRGARVTLIDAYGPGNSRSTSGDETRGIRSSYGDRATGELWTPWARAAIERWRLFEQEWAPVFRTSYFQPMTSRSPLPNPMPASCAAAPPRRPSPPSAKRWA
jgi:hypothetical protein